MANCDKLRNIIDKNFFFSRLFIYVILALVIYISVGQLCHLIRVWYLREWTVQLYRVADAMLLALPVFYCKKKSIVISYLFVLNIYFLSVIWYLRTYGTIMPPSSYLLFNNLNGLGASVLHAMRAKDLFIILPSCCFILFYCKISRKIQQKKRFVPYAFILSFLFLIIVTGSAYSRKSYFDWPLYWYSIEQVRSFKQYGFIHYWIYQVRFYQGASDSEKSEAVRFMNKWSDEGGFVNCDSLNTGKNLILILVESMQSWPIGLTVQGVEITPYINNLLKYDNTLFFKREVPQVKDGRSSDAQLLLNTGLLPLLTGATSGLYSNNVFPSLPDALKEKGYFTASFVCDEKEYWNQGTMTRAYHFDKLYDRLQGNEGREKADENLFEKAFPLLERMSTPFYAQLVTLSGHAPYLKPLIDSPLKSALLGRDEEVRNYLIAMQYMDRCIGRFIDKLRASELYDNSVIVITGDHEEMTFNRYEGREPLQAEDCYVPFIILNSPLSSRHTDKVIGQVDIYPSLLNLMGCCDYSFRGLGESVFLDSISNYAAYRTGIATGGTNVSDSIKKHREYCWRISDILLRMDYFNGR